MKVLTAVEYLVTKVKNYVNSFFNLWGHTKTNITVTKTGGTTTSTNIYGVRIKIGQLYIVTLSFTIPPEYCWLTFTTDYIGTLYANLLIGCRTDNTIAHRDYGWVIESNASHTLVFDASPSGYSTTFRGIIIGADSI